MKNKRMQFFVEQAKKARKKVFSDSKYYNAELGVKIYHCYDEPRTLSYWDDVTFPMGSQAVFVFWTHPRYHYTDTLDMEAYEYADKMYPERKPFIDALMGDDGEKHYVKVGKSRKKLVSTSINSETPDGFYPCWKDKREELFRTSQLREGTKFKVEQGQRGKFVDICCPIEIRCEHDLAVLAALVKDCLNDRTLFKRLYGDYTYGAEEYMKEFPVKEE